MNHNRLPTKSPEIPAATDTLDSLRDRIGTFVQALGPAVPFPEGTYTIDTGKEPPRPLITSGQAPTVYLTFPGSLLKDIAPEATQRLQIEELSLSRDTPIYNYAGGESIPSSPQDVDMEALQDPYWASGGGSGVYIGKPPDALFESTFYKLSARGDFSRESEPHEGDPWPSQDPSYVSEQERDDINAILDALSRLNKDKLASVMQVEVL